MRAPPDRHARGYTLIELVVVLAVLGLAAAVTVPAIGRSVEDLRARAEVAGVAAFLRSAREQAVIRHRPYVVAFDGRARTVRLLRSGDASLTAVQASRHLSSLLDVGPGSAATLWVTFLPQGTSSGGRLELHAPRSRVYVITVDALTGRVATERIGS